MFSTEVRYAVVRYMLNELGDEAANVGIIAVVDDPPKLYTRFLPDPTVKSRADSRVNRATVERFESLAQEELERAAGDPGSFAERALMRLSELSSGLVRVSAPRSVLTNDVPREIELLYSQVISPPAPSQRRELGPRDPLGGLKREARSTIERSLRGAMSLELRKKAFKPAHVIKGVQHASVFDAAVVTRIKKQTTEHLFHHVLLLPDAEESFNQAVALLWKWNDVQEKNGKDRSLTAVMFSRKGTRREGIEEAKSILRKEKVQIAEVQQLAGLVRKLEPQLELVE